MHAERPVLWLAKKRSRWADDPPGMIAPRLSHWGVLEFHYARDAIAEARGASEVSLPPLQRFRAGCGARRLHGPVPETDGLARKAAGLLLNRRLEAFQVVEKLLQGLEISLLKQLNQWRLFFVMLARESRRRVVGDSLDSLCDQLALQVF